MKLFKSRSKHEWESFLHLSSDEQLSKERWELTRAIREARQKKLDIQAEVDRRTQENPPERGQVVRI